MSPILTSALFFGHRRPILANHLLNRGLKPFHISYDVIFVSCFSLLGFFVADLAENCRPNLPSAFSSHHYAKIQPDKPAVIMAGIGLPAGQEPEIVTYRQLEERSNQMAHFFRAHGLQRFDTVAIFMGNNARYHEVVWGAQRAGLRFVTVSSKLAAGELQYILEDSGAKIVIASPELIGVARTVAANMLHRNTVEFYMVADEKPVGIHGAAIGFSISARAHSHSSSSSLGIPVETARIRKGQVPCYSYCGSVCRISRESMLKIRWDCRHSRSLLALCSTDAVQLWHHRPPQRNQTPASQT